MNRQSLPRLPTAGILALACAWACQKTLPDSAPRPVEERSPPSAAATQAPPRAPATHVIAESDHLKLVEVGVGDVIELPADDDFDWSVRSTSELLVEPAPGASGGRERYRAAKAGSTKMVVDGDPKCLKRKGGCGTSKREWTIFVVVH